MSNLIIAIICVCIVILIYILIMRPASRRTARRKYKEMMRSGAAALEDIDIAIAAMAEPAPVDIAHRANNMRIIAEQQDDPAARTMTMNFARNLVVHAINPRVPTEAADDDLYMLVQLAGHFPQIMTAPQITHQTIDRVIAAAPTRAKAAEDITEHFAAVNSDSQNVHDSTFNKMMNESIDKLLECRRVSPEAAIKEARIAAMSSANSTNAAKALDVIAKGLPYGKHREDVIFAAVWSRIHSASDDKKDTIREAVVAALGDCVERGEVVCTSGRVARIVESLTLVDDIVDGGAATSDMYKNQIFGEVRDLMRYAPAISDSPNIKLVAAAYDDPSIETTPEAEDEYRAFMTAKIDEHLEQYKNKLTPAMFNFIRDGCIAAIV